MKQGHVLTLGEASKLTGKAKTTLSNAITKGIISARKRKNPKGQMAYEIEASELFRVFPALSQEEGKPQEMTLDSKRLIELEARLSMMDSMLDSKDSQIDRLKEECIRWDNHTTKLLEDKRSVDQQAQDRLDRCEAEMKRAIEAEAEKERLQRELEQRNKTIQKLQKSRLGRWLLKKSS